VVPTLLTWPESSIVHDIKGENWTLTAGFRSRFGRVLKFDPTEALSAAYNPLLEVRRGDKEVRDVGNGGRFGPAQVPQVRGHSCRHWRPHRDGGRRQNQDQRAAGRDRRSSDRRRDRQESSFAGAVRLDDRLCSQCDMCKPVGPGGRLKCRGKRDHGRRAARLEQLDILLRSNKAQFGIASLRPNASLYGDRVFDAAALQSYIDGDAVGVLAARFIDAWDSQSLGHSTIA
jgi:hypothetical protein